MGPRLASSSCDVLRARSPASTCPITGRRCRPISSTFLQFISPRHKVNTPTALRFVYTTFVAIDANFRLKRRAISSDARDPSMSSGWGCFVEGREYREHILKHTDQQDVSLDSHSSFRYSRPYQISTCTGFAALMNANKSMRGYATSGVAMAIDARHGFILPNGVGDLQKGER